MATTKGGKRATEAAQDANNWNILERLILSQALYQHGVDNLPSVVTLMSSHPMLSRPKNFFSVKSCSAVYEKLMDESSLTRPEPAGSRHAPQLKALATIFYKQRAEELKDSIGAEEAKFKTLVREIDEIRAGLWDDRIRRGQDNAPGVSQVDETVTVDAEPTTVIVEGEANFLSEEAPSPAVPSTGVQIELFTSQETADQISSNGEIDASAAPGDTPGTQGTLDQALEVPDASTHNRPAEEEEEELRQEVEKVIDEPEVLDEDQEEEASQPQEAAEPEPELMPSVEDEASAMNTSEGQQQVQPTHEQFLTPEEDAEMAASPDSLSLRDAKRKASEAPSDVTRDRKRFREDSEAMDEEEPGPSAGRGRKKMQGVPDKKFQNVINMLHSSISQHRYGNIFHNPIKKQDASDYHDIVKRPMDLKTIKQRVKEVVISNSLEFQRDVYLMFANAMIYNRPGSEIHAMAEEMMLESEIQINAFRQTEGFHRL